MKKLVLLLILGLSLVSFVYAAQTITPIYCNQYSFTCCVSQVDYQKSITLDSSPGGNFICPQTSSGCRVSSSTNSFYLGDGNNCNYRTGWRYLGIPYFHCDNDQEVSAPRDLTPGQIVYGGAIYKPNIQINVYKNSLLFTGRAGSSSGTEVIGADGCQFNPSDTRDSSGGLVKFDASGVSYTAPAPTSLGSASSNCVLTWLSGDRTMCGNLEEQCSGDSDCLGHTYGSKECTARTLQIYGCIQTGNNLPNGVENVNGNNVYFNTQGSSPTFGNIVTSRCDLKNSQQVQCCGDTDCGTNMFCDNNPSSPTAWTCQKKVQCHQDSDCGTSSQCDYIINTLKTPSCQDGQCTFNSVKVDCCTDQNCQSGGYCSNEHKCLNSQVKSSSLAQSENQGVSNNSLTSSGNGKMWMIILGLIVIAATIGVFFYLKSKESGSSTLGNKCSNCGHGNKEGAKFCIGCGTKIESSSKGEIKCKSCGHLNQKGKKFCINCGAKMASKKK